MSRRNECLISNYEEAVAWLEEFKHTITDEAVLKVVECLQSSTSEEFKDLQAQLDNAEERNLNLEKDIDDLEERIEELVQAAV